MTGVQTCALPICFVTSLQSLIAGIPPSSEPSDVELPPTTLQQAVFGLSAVTNPGGTLKECHILWTPVVSAGEKLPLPLDDCCSVSLVSRSHADLVASKCPQLKYQSLEKPVAVSGADGKAQLQAVGTMEIPIQYVEQWQRNNISDAGSSWSFLAHSFWGEPFALYTGLGGSC